MRKIKWHINTGFPTARHEGVWEVEDDTTEEELNDMLRMEVADRIDAGWHEGGDDAD